MSLNRSTATCATIGTLKLITGVLAAFLCINRAIMASNSEDHNQTKSTALAVIWGIYSLGSFAVSAYCYRQASKQLLFQPPANNSTETESFLDENDATSQVKVAH